MNTRFLPRLAMVAAAGLLSAGLSAEAQVACELGTACEQAGCPLQFEIFPDAENPLIPISDLSQPDYHVNGCLFEVGRYPGRTNEMPCAHFEAGMAEGDQIVPRGVDGEPDAENGLIGVLSIGASNMRSTFGTYITEHIIPLQLPEIGGLNERLVFVNGALSGNATCSWAKDPILSSDGNPWGNIIINELAQGRQPGLGDVPVVVDPLQIQVVWIVTHQPPLAFCLGVSCGCAPDLCNDIEPLACDPPGYPTDPGAGTGCQFPNWVFDETDGMLNKVDTIVLQAREVFPNIRQIFVSNEAYGGYAGDFECESLCPEPWGYHHGFMVKALVTRQIEGQMPFGDNGPYPWVAWGADLWGNGILADWRCYHFCSDGGHPSDPATAKKFGYPESGQSRLAGMFSDFLHTDPIASKWFLAGATGDCDGDANGDGTVDPLDTGYVLARLGCPVGAGDEACDAADVNGDMEVDPLDAGYVLARFGICES